MNIKNTFKEEIISSSHNVNGTTSVRATSKMINFVFGLVIIIPAVVVGAFVYGWGWETIDSYGVCVTAYTQKVEEIKTKRKELVKECTEKYPSDVKGLSSCISTPPEYPKMECDNTSQWTHSTGITVPPPKWIEPKKNEPKSVQQLPKKTTQKQTESSIKSKNSIEKKVVVGDSHKPSTSKDTYWDAYERSIKLIQKYEGIRLKAYPDYGGCSIWWGTRAKSCKEVITQAEADRRISEVVHKVLKRVRNDFPQLTPPQQSALVSFAYNCHKGYESMRKNWLYVHSKWCRTAWGERLQWLVNRRLEESTLLFWKQ